MPRFDTTKTLLSLLKITGAALVIWAVGWAVVVLDSHGTVSDSQADIVDFGFGPASPHQRFGKALERLGHDEPQALELNGNTVYFSVNYAKQPPRQLMERYQREFVAQRVNDRAYGAPEADRGNDDDERMSTALTGGVVPQLVSRDYVTMGGMTMNGEPTDSLEVIRRYRPDFNEAQMFSGHRYIEMFNQPGRRGTTVLASWSDDEFDYAKMVPGQQREGLSVDVDVPACPGCTRVNRLRDLDRDRFYEANIFVTSRPHEQLEQFYQSALARRGWRQRSSNASLSNIQNTVDFTSDDSTVVSFDRPEADDERILTILIYSVGQGQTAVHTSMTRDAQLAEDNE